MENAIFNKLVLTKDKQEENFEKVFANTILAILKEENVVRIREETDGIYCIEYEHDNQIDYWGGPNCVWLSEEESDKLECLRLQAQEDEVPLKIGKD